MNKKNIITLLLALVAINGQAQFLFRISGNKLKEPSYILGSIHTLPGLILDSIPEYLEAEAKSKQLFAEYDISDQQKIQPGHKRHQLFRHPGQSLQPAHQHGELPLDILGGSVSFV